MDQHIERIGPRVWIHAIRYPGRSLEQLSIGQAKPCPGVFKVVASNTDLKSDGWLISPISGRQSHRTKRQTAETTKMRQQRQIDEAQETMPATVANMLDHRDMEPRPKVEARLAPEARGAEIAGGFIHPRLTRAGFAVRYQMGKMVWNDAAGQRRADPAGHRDLMILGEPDQVRREIVVISVELASRHIGQIPASFTDETVPSSGVDRLKLGEVEVAVRRSYQMDHGLSPIGVDPDSIDPARPWSFQPSSSQPLRQASKAATLLLETPSTALAAST